MYTAIRRNRITTVVLIVGYIALIVGIGVALSFALNSVWPVVVLSILAAIHVLWAWFDGERACLAAFHGRTVTERDDARFYRTVETLAIRNGMPMPRLVIDESDLSINAFAQGMRPSQAVVGVTRGSLDNLDNSELEAVMSHEMSHIKNGDSRVKVLVTALVGAMQLIGLVLILGGIGGNRDRSTAGAVVGFLLIVLCAPFLIVGFIIGPIVRSAVSRQRESLADASGVEMTRFVPGMISLFRKMEMEQFGTTGVEPPRGVMGIFYAYRRPRRGLAYWFTATHPHTYKRIEQVEEMERTF